MKRLNLIAPALTLLAATTTQAQFTPGNLAVLRVGDGASALTLNSAPIFVEQYDRSSLGQSPSYTFAVPSTGVDAFTISGSALTEGTMSLSTDGRYLSFAGYFAVPETIVVASSAGSVNRGAGLLDVAGGFTLPVRSSEAFSSSNVRSAVTTDGTQFWLTGSGTGIPGTGGVWHYTGGIGTDVYDDINNTRVANIQNGDLYFSTGSFADLGIHAFTGLPTTAESSASQVIISPVNGSPLDFALNPDGNVLYITEDTLPGAQGIQRWEFGAGWELAYTLGTGVANVGASGLAVDWTGANPILYAVTAETTANRLIRIEDTGGTSTAETLATSQGSSLFRSVDFSPIPEPGTGALFGMGIVGLWFASRQRPAARS